LQQRSLGSSDLRVSELCLGTMFFGTLVDEVTAFAILDRFAEAGGTFLDTANNYAFWVDGGTGADSEELLGRWLARRSNGRDIVLATKVGAAPDKGRAGSWPQNAEGLRPERIIAQAEASRRRLGVEQIDLYYAHLEDREVPIAESLDAFAELAANGTIGALGISNHHSWRIERMRQLAASNGGLSPICVQQSFSYLQPRPGSTIAPQLRADDELLDYVRESDDLTLLAYSPLLGGAYTRDDKPRSPDYDHAGTDRRLAALDQAASELGATRNQVVLAWLLGGDPPIIPVIGASSVAQLNELLAATELQIPAELRALLDSTH
jgi:aryl-alcohol dehydrogenase-like predicted oxidoreductase